MAQERPSQAEQERPRSPDEPNAPHVEDIEAHVVAKLNGQVVAESRRAKKVTQTNHEPAYYVPRDTVQVELDKTDTVTRCPWKGYASHFRVRSGNEVVEDAVWIYEDPYPAYRQLAGWVAFYPEKLDEVTVDGEPAPPQGG